MSFESEQDLTVYRLPDEYLSFAEEFFPALTEPIDGTFVSVWEINKLSELLSDPEVIGSTFKTNEYKWNVSLCLNSSNDCLSIYLNNEDLSKGELGHDICAQVMLCIVNPTDYTQFRYQAFQHRFNTYEPNLGFPDYENLESLLTGDTAIVVEDSVNIICIVRLVHDATGILWHKFIGYDSKQTTGHVGLYNQGATCYMNSLFQSLFFTNLYRKVIFEIPTENDDPNKSIVLALQRLFYHLQFSDAAVSTTELTNSFGWNSADAFRQHDVQEFNRLLQDSIEKKMKNTPAPDAIKQLFVGKMKSYVKCIYVDYESSRIEEYYDIQLNVKGCKDLESSFQAYISEEVLQGDNKYSAADHGLQDAKKGVLFDSFPPVLHLQLKRFEYDMVTDNMVKINDRHEFPEKINLRPFLSESMETPQVYVLHGVLVHTGNLTGGHYYSFVRPKKDNKWFKFDDDRVTPASLQQVFEANFGGDDSSPIHTSAYMLVYIRQIFQDKVLAPVTSQDIPTHLVERIKQEDLLNQMIRKQRSEQHLYMKAYIADLYSFTANTSSGFIDFEEASSTIVQVKHVLKNRPLKSVLLDYATERGINAGHLRLWNLANRMNGWVQLDGLFSDAELDTSTEMVCQAKSNYPFLRVYIEHVTIQNQAWFPLDTYTMILVFVKLFDPVTRTIRSVGSLYVPKVGLVSDITNELLQRADQSRETNIDVYEECGPGLIQKLEMDKTFESYGIIDGDIIVFQVKASEEDTKPNAIEYINFLHNRMPVTFKSKKEPHTSVTLELLKSMKYDDIVFQLGHVINWDPERLVLILPDNYGKVGRDVKKMERMTLLDISLVIPRSNVNNQLYYDTLPISLSEYETKKLIPVCVCYPSLNQFKHYQVLLPKLANCLSLSRSIASSYTKESGVNLRVFQVNQDKLVKVFKAEEIIESDEKLPIYAEIVPKEEFNIGDQDFFISVYHYQKELTQTHSVPFKFLVIKDEVFYDTRKRLQARCGLNDELWNQVHFYIVKKFGTIIIDRDNYRLSDHSFKPDELLGLDHTDPLGKYSTTILDKALYIKD
ncbi:cysteine proteinase [Helicostylum pulchrum]|nr:cysteine proteinase [Helicostylum pulchrum]